MKVRELLEALKAVDLEAEVIVASDSEGNGFSPLDGIDAGFSIYNPTTLTSGEVLHEDWGAKARA